MAQSYTCSVSLENFPVCGQLAKFSEILSVWVTDICRLDFCHLVINNCGHPVKLTDGEKEVTCSYQNLNVSLGWVRLA